MCTEPNLSQKCILFLGLFSTVNAAYQSSLEAAERVAMARTTLSQSVESRKGVNGLEGKSREAVFDLETLKDELSYPNLTPTVNRVIVHITIIMVLFIIWI